MKAGIGISISVGLLMVLALTTISCSNNQPLYGRWEGDRDWKALNLDNEAVARAVAAVNLTLKPDGSFVLQDGGTPFTGSWNRSDSGIDLHVETILNRPLAQQQESTQKQAEFVIRLDKERMFYKSPGDRKEFELKKKAQP